MECLGKVLLTSLSTRSLILHVSWWRSNASSPSQKPGSFDRPLRSSSVSSRCPASDCKTNTPTILVSDHTPVPAHTPTGADAPPATSEQTPPQYRCQVTHQCPPTPPQTSVRSRQCPPTPPQTGVTLRQCPLTLPQIYVSDRGSARPDPHRLVSDDGSARPRSNRRSGSTSRIVVIEVV